VHGRLENGEAPVRLSDEEVTIEYTPPSPSQRLLGSVMPLVNAAAASGADKGHTPASVFVFNMFGQAVLRRTKVSGPCSCCGVMRVHRLVSDLRRIHERFQDIS
jgi:hypothetical protein